MKYGSSESGFSFSQLTITIDGVELVTTDIHIHQSCNSACTFSFIWIVLEEEATFKNYIDFYTKNMGAEVSIKVGDSYSFSGLINEISTVNQENVGNWFQIGGRGLMGKADEVVKCRNFYKKTLQDIFKTVSNESGFKLRGKLRNTDVQHYIVQHNQTNLQFLQMLAIRFGEWFFYDGVDVHLTLAKSKDFELVNNVDIFEVDISGTFRHKDVSATSIDYFTGKPSETKKPDPTKSPADFLKSMIDAGKKVMGASESTYHAISFPTSKLNKTFTEVAAGASIKNSLIISASIYYDGLTLGSHIKITDFNNDSSTGLIIYEIDHYSNPENNYIAKFKAIPDSIIIPPYSDPFFFPTSKSMLAKVIDNVDKDNFDRIKVKFPYGGNDEESNSPWIPVIVPYAGKNRGFKFLPEVDDLVMVGFLDNNIERPFIMGTWYNGEEVSGVKGEDFEKNEKKIIGSFSGRRLEIDEKDNQLVLRDNFEGKFPQNFIKQSLGEDKNMELVSASGKDSYARLFLETDKTATFEIAQSGNSIVSIQIKSDDKSLNIKSQGPIVVESMDSIEITAAKNLSFTAGQNVEFTAGQGFKVTAGQNFEVTAGMGFEVTASTSVKLTGGTSAEITGGAQAKLTGGGMTTIKGAVVMIN